MTKAKQQNCPLTSSYQMTANDPNFQKAVDKFKQLFLERMERSVAAYLPKSTTRDRYRALAYAVRDLLMSRWLHTQTTYYDTNPKRVYYLSMEFLLGRTLGNAIINIGLEEVCRHALREMGYEYDEIESMEWDAGLGNGGLGRLAACFLDSMATLSLPAYGYGIYYEFGMFKQELLNGQQHETADTWLRYGNPFEIERNNFMYTINFGGNVEAKRDFQGRTHYDWVNCEQVMAMAHDIPVPGYNTSNVNSLRLWSAKATREFNLRNFDAFDYFGAVNEKNQTETISKVLYPNDNNIQGKILRLKQQYFMVSATIQDILRRFHNCGDPIENFPEKAVLQLNDTHPTLAIPELMRIFLDEYELPWENAWGLTQRSVAYTNHTVMPEALEKWPIELFEKILPRHLQIIYDINARFLDEVKISFPNDEAKIASMSIIEEQPIKAIRMAYLAIVGSFSVNGVAALHTQILKEKVFKDFYQMYPEKFNNKTNGVTPRRWIRKANEQLSSLISSKIGEDWIHNLKHLKQLEVHSNDAAFLSTWQEVKRKNKEVLAKIVNAECLLKIDPNSLFDIQVKRFHEYKRQHLNLLHAIYLYHHIKDNPNGNHVPRTIIFGGKAAPGYYMAKSIIHLINSVASIINRDATTKNFLKIVFIPNYGVTLAEKIIAGADLSEQISTAGMEASGTSNMKFAMNGALTIGTLDGANIEIMQNVGQDNIFIFGHTEESLHRLSSSYNPMNYYEKDNDLKRVIDAIADGTFSKHDKELFANVVNALLRHDRFFVLADFRSYIEAQAKVSELYTNPQEWHKKAIINVSRMSYFSSDRTIEEYVNDIWRVSPSKINLSVEQTSKGGID
ncbi:MAG: glycogen/starch/alpha-glucan phosphorylase [Oligoflexia bacterium]|nr:glycogen/starch/alpha-glucan phosphorylase [Oligoflexia bacterium]MBF0364920.1 glycogen/starch/alpha-glucan phosphorylase [Oligoflexia bacterium]